MATGNLTTKHKALSELAARAKRIGLEVHEQIGDDEREWRYRLVGPNVTDEGLADMLDKLGTPAALANQPAQEPAAPRAQADIADTEGWTELYECRNLLAVFRRALESEEEADPTSLEYQAQARMISSKISHAMDALEKWAKGWDKASNGGGAA